MTYAKPLLLGTAILLAGCTPSLDDRVSVTRGATFFAENCAACHGSDARGDIGPDLTLLSQRNGGTFPQLDTLATIYGPAYHQSRGTIMPEFGADDLGPLVVVELEDGIGTPVPADLIALSEYLRSVQR
ncbi:c-type cytochrome [Gymnodinialimonas ulvae]|uniref:c-type cytochrome n=1 Tax=Gymnodinialimonas ulvae TaxID=3126504 RepID=UPI0030AA8D9C